MTSMDRVLLVDDDPDLQQLLLIHLTNAGFSVEAVATGAGCLEAAARERPLVVTLDLMLPDVPGTEVCRRLRSELGLEHVGVLMLTARGDEYDRVVGFEVGADDYVVKPFSVREVVLRVKALARRSSERYVARGAADTGTRLSWRGLSVDPVRHRVYADGVELSLRPLEYKLLVLLLERSGVVFSRADLLTEVWDIRGQGSPRTVDTHVRRLREKLGAHGDAIETVHGFGYRLRDP